jgi:hypothetical protein
VWCWWEVPDKGDGMSEYAEFRADTVEPEPLLRALACAVGDGKATYVSGPITTGRHFLDWLVTDGEAIANKDAYASRLRAEVVEPNERRIRAVAEAARRRRVRAVIEPASLRVPQWSQTDYLSFWLRVIDQFAEEMIVVNGWQYSIGCVAEFRHAAARGIPVMDEDDVAVSLATGRRLVAEGLANMEELGRRSDFVANMVKVLRAYDL